MHLALLFYKSGVFPAQIFFTLVHICMKALMSVKFFVVFFIMCQLSTFRKYELGDNIFLIVLVVKGLMVSSG